LVGPTPPTDAAQCRFAALDTATPYLLQHDPADGGKLAHYLLERNGDGEPRQGRLTLPWLRTFVPIILFCV